MTPSGRSISAWSRAKSCEHRFPALAGGLSHQFVFEELLTQLSGDERYSSRVSTRLCC